MSVLGYEESFKDSLLVRINDAPKLDIKLSYIRGLVLLKLISWKDGFPSRDRDAVDFGISRISFSWRKDVQKEEGNFNQGFSTYEASLLSSGIEQDITLSEKLKGVVGLRYDLLTPIFANKK